MLVDWTVKEPEDSREKEMVIFKYTLSLRRGLTERRQKVRRYMELGTARQRLDGR